MRKTPHAQAEVAKKVFEQKLASEPPQNDPLVNTIHGKAKSEVREKRLLRRSEVEERTGLARSTIYDWMRRGEFPKPVKLGKRLVAWRENEVDAWLEAREVREAECLGVLEAATKRRRI